MADRGYLFFQRELKRRVIFCAIFVFIFSAASCGKSVDEVKFGIVKGNIIFCDLPYENAVEVKLESDRFGTLVTQSDSDGKFSFSDIWEGDYTLKFYSPDVEFDPSSIDFKYNGVSFDAENINVIKSWKHSEGSDFPDELFSSIMQTDDYGYIAVGRKGYDQSCSSVITKYDRNGIIVWSATLNDSNQFSDLCSVKKYDDMYYACGVSSVRDGDSSVITAAFSDTRNISDPIPVSSYYSLSYSQFYTSGISSCLELVDGKMHIAGKSNYQTSGIYDYFILSQKFDSTEKKAFSDTSALDGKTEFVSLKAFGDDIYAFGNEAVVDNSDPDSPVITNCYKPMLYIFDKSYSNSSVNYYYPIEGCSSSTASAIEIDKDSNIFLAIGSKKENYDSEKPVIIKCKTSPPSIQLWKVYPDGENFGKIYDIKSDGEGGLVGTGCRNFSDLGVSVMTVFRIDSDGKLKWFRVFSGSGTVEESGRCINVTKDGGVIVGGTLSASGGRKGDFAVIKLNKNGEIYGSDR